MMCICLTYRCKNRNWHCKFQCTGKINHKNRQCLGHISCECICKSCTSKCIRNQSVCKMFCFALHCRFQFFSLFDHGYDLFKLGRARSFFYANGKFTFLHNRSGIYITGFMFCHRHGFPCQRRLIYHSLAFCNNTVKRNYGSHMYTDSVTRFNFICSYLNFRILCYQPYLAHIQGHASCQIIHRLFVCPVFKNLTKAKKEHYGRSCTEVTSEHGYTDRRCIQYRNFNSAFCKCAHTFPDIFHRFQRCQKCPDRKWQEYFLTIMEHNMVYHLLPVFSIHFSS